VSNLQTPNKASSHLLSRSVDDSENDGGLKRIGFFKGLFQKKNRPVYGINRKFFDFDFVRPELWLTCPPGELSTNLHEGTFEMGVGRIMVAPTGKKKDPTEWNLLDRLLWFKPESKVLVMCHDRKNARVILCDLLSQDWNTGIKDVVFDRNNRNTFSGRLDKENSMSPLPDVCVRTLN
jgi:hypothetical protein